MSQATLNVRMPQELKRNGDRVLEREGISVSDAVRKLYEYLEQEQEFPEVLVSSDDEQAAKIERRRAAVQSLIGILPSDVSEQDVKEVRRKSLLRKSKPGVRV